MTGKPGRGGVAKYCLLVSFPYSLHLAVLSGYKVFKKLVILKMFCLYFVIDIYSNDFLLGGLD